MPIIYKCKNCGYVLYDSRNWKKYTNRYYGIPTPSEVAAWYGGHCPNCGKPLNTKPDPVKDVVIRITKPPFLKTNSSQSIENGGKHEEEAEVPKGCSNNRHEARCSSAASEGHEGEAASKNSFQNMESNKKRA